MTRRFSVAIGVAIVALGIAGRAVAQTADPAGVWMTQAGDARVKISKCGGGICGTIVGLRDKIDPATGLPAVDSKNRNPALANRPMIGLVLFSGMQPSAPGKWSGSIYNADDGATYASNISLNDPNSLRVEGCVGVLCGGETWTRVGR